MVRVLTHFFHILQELVSAFQPFAIRKQTWQGGTRSAAANETIAEFSLVVPLMTSDYHSYDTYPVIIFMGLYLPDAEYLEFNKFKGLL